MNLIMIVNPNAGKKQGLEKAEFATDILRDKGCTITSLVSDKVGGTRELAESADLEGVDGVLAVGGDGTLFEVINGLLKGREALPVPLGQIPVGTGNSFIKDLGVESVEDALEMIVSGNTKAVDLGHLSCSDGQFYFANLLGSGFVSNVAYRAGRYKAFGSLSYIFGVLEEMLVMKATPIEMEMDGRKITRHAVFTEICNSRFTGGDMMMAPDAVIDDGMLDVVMMNKASRFKLLSLLPLIFKGHHVNDPVIETYRAKKVTLRASRPLMLTPDGETFGTTPIDVTLHPGKIRMFC